MDVIKSAIVNNEFIPFLQPLIESKSGKLVGCEVLLRWNYKNSVIIHPDEFISFIENNAMIIEITKGIMYQVECAFKDIAYKISESFTIGFNISAMHCNDMDIVNDCCFFLSAIESEYIHLNIEITERKYLQHTTVSQQVFKGLHDLGVTLSIDDFGTGYSNLIYLQDFNFDIIKIDKKFVKYVGINNTSDDIISCIVSLAEHLKLKTVAEGVETNIQADRMRELNVDYLQGYLYGHPLPLNSFIDTWFYN
ncbi:EAL domain-containing protein [Serratia sp. T13T92]|uniref:EAL domain-containing protein n=1 Tax=Serratia sp. T13T92 TaxID=3397496 RepID=UPI0039E06F5B